MSVLVYTHPSCWRHEAGARHPERPARLDAVLAGVRTSGVAWEEREASEVELADLALVHEPSYVAEIRRFCAQGGGALDPDTAAVAASWEAALHAAGAGTAAVEALRRGDGEAAFLAVRPPGHHALATRAMGFCLFNNIAVAASRLAADGERVAIFDWDVHHGNGTQQMFYRNGEVLYVSFHEFPAYPGSGWVDERGSGAGGGGTLNLPFPAGTAGDAYRAALTDIAAPLIERFRPDWILVSAGYDAHAADPLASIRLVAADYGFMSARLWELVASGRTLYFLEGGYDLEALEASVAATLARRADGDTETTSPSSSAWRIIDLAADAAAGQGG